MEPKDKEPEDEFIDYKRRRLEEIAAVIRASEEDMTLSIDRMNTQIDDLYLRLEKLRNQFTWLK